MLSIIVVSTIITLALFVFGIVAAWSKTWPEIPYCLSDFYYVFGGKRLFSIWFILITCGLSSPLLYFFSTTSSWWVPLLVSVGCLGVGLAPDFKNSKTQYRIHMTGALMAMIGSQWIFSFYPISYLGWIVFGSWALGSFIHQRIHRKGGCSGSEAIEELFEGEDWLWWMEFSMFVGIFIFIFKALIFV